MTAVFDASAVIAILRTEEGSANAYARIAQAGISIVNLAEVVTKLTGWHVPRLLIESSIDELKLAILPFDRGLAIETGSLHALTQGQNISLGDRACLATARSYGVPAVTADRNWAKLELGIEIELIR